jgi:hypothetical protein
MFENLSKRERVLAIALAGLLPLALGFIAVFWFISKYGENDLEIGSLITRISEEEDKVLRARKAMKRMDYYQHTSLSQQEFSKATGDYQLWLLDLARRHQLKGVDINPQEGQPLKFKNRKVGETQVLKFAATGGLESITVFLSEFYSLNTMHRVKGMRLYPQSQIVNGKRVRTGIMSVTLDIELAVLEGGNAQFNFAKANTQPARSLEDYQQAIVSRNIFGPPNNTPMVSVRPSASYASGTEIRVTIRGEDGDKDDQLQFDLLSAGIEGSRIEPRENSRDATLILPSSPAGTYAFKVGIKDNGFPVKESNAEFQIVLKNPPNKKPSVVAKLSNPYPPDRPIELVLEGSDGDSQDILEFAIVQGVDGAQIVKSEKTDREPVLQIPPLGVGTYPFVVSIRDGREEPNDKVVEKSFEVQVLRKFSHLNETRITGIVRDKTGVWLANVRIRTTGQRFSLSEGESFEVEQQTFTVEKIETNQVTFICGNQRMVFEPGKPFASPKQVESFSNSSDDGVKTGNETAGDAGS